MDRWQRILLGASSYVLSPFVNVEDPGVCERRNGVRQTKDVQRDRLWSSVVLPTAARYLQEADALR